MDTKSAILDAAEQAFAEHGFEAASLRSIIATAKVNVAAIHYHFGSKEALIEAVFERRLKPVNSRRLALLDAAEARAGSAPAPLEAVVRALAEPMLALAHPAGKGGGSPLRLFGRVIAEPSEVIQRIMRKQFGHVVRRFSAAFARSLPDLPEAVVIWRFHFCVGAMAHIMSDPTRLRQFTHGLCDPADSEEVVRQLVVFLSAGLRSPAP